MASDSRLASILDDPLFFDKDLFTGYNFQIAPLRDPFPSHWLERPHPVEPENPSSSPHGAAKSGNLPDTVGIDSAQSTGVSSRAKSYKSNSKKATVSIKEVLNDETNSSDNLDIVPGYELQGSPRKKRRLENSKSAEFVHLPKPPVVKKSQKAPRIPPLLQGLHEPPPDAGLFPPITETAFQDFVNPKSVPATQTTGEKPGIALASLPIPENQSEVREKKSARQDKRNKWTEDETKDLLQGVALFGIGRWKQILAHPDFNFHGRSAIDLKDRFRTCCPKGYTRDSNSAQSSIQTPSKTPAASSLSKILAPASPSPAESTKSSNKTKPTRSHAKTEADLNAMGISKPFRKSDHRSRNPFTKEEDAAIVQGFERHGPAWLVIRNDPEYAVLAARKPTDLRDRLRNMYPDKYKLAGLKMRPKTFSKPGERAGMRPESPASPPAATEGSMSDSKAQHSVAALSTSTYPVSAQGASNTATTIEPSSLLLLQKPLASFNLFSSTFPDVSDPFSTSDGTDIHAAHYGDAHTPVMLDRSIFDWANQNTSTNSSSGGNGARNAMSGAAAVPSTSSGAAATGAGGNAPALPLEVTHINPLVTWKPASGLF